MKLKIKNKKQSKLNWFTLLLVFTIFTNNIWSQNNIDTTLRYQQDTIIKSQADKDWEHFNNIKNLLTSGYKERKRLEEANLFGYFKIIDSIKQYKSKISIDFLNNYPNDPRCDEVLNYFFSVHFMPTFILQDAKVSKEQLDYLNQFPRKSSAIDRDRAFRGLPIDREAKDQWLQYGNDLVTKTLASNLPSELKYKMTVRLINRDFALAKEWYIQFYKDPMETDYWEYFDVIYWESFKQRLFDLIDAYPESDHLSQYIPAFFHSLKRYSPKLAHFYLKIFYLKTGNNHPQSNYNTGIKNLNTALEQILDSWDAINDGSFYNTPLDMDLTTMDGTKIDLSDMRGKVVLIDFWNIGCSPCIKEMPHVQTLYDKYKKYGFEVIGIAANGDDAKNHVLQIIEKTGAKWPQILDEGKEANVKYHILYKIKSLPTVWLLDKDGKIVDRNARGERLEPLILKYLGLDSPDK